MITIQTVQIFIILSFIYSVRLKVWNTSLNTFIVIATMFLLTISREIPYLKKIWIDYHVTVVGVMLFIIMARVVFQSVRKKYRDSLCNDCTNYNSRSKDNE